MAQSKQWMAVRDKTVGDTAVDGLLSGMAAGVVMAATLLAAGFAGGEGPGEVLGRFDLTAEHSALTGGLLHLATSAVYGLAFALVARVLVSRRQGLARFGWALGMAYGLGLFVLAWLWLIPMGSPLRGLGPAAFALAHAVYGVVLGYQVGKHMSG